METKQLIIIVLAIIVAGCIIAGACAYSIMSANNDSNMTNTTNSTNSTNATLINSSDRATTISEEQYDSSSSQRSGDSSPDITIDPDSYNYATLQGYDSEGHKYYMWDGEWRTQKYMDTEATLE